MAVTRTRKHSDERLPDQARAVVSLRVQRIWASSRIFHPGTEAHPLLRGEKAFPRKTMTAIDSI